MDDRATILTASAAPSAARAAEAATGAAAEARAAAAQQAVPVAAPVASAVNSGVAGNGQQAPGLGFEELEKLPNEGRKDGACTHL